MSYVGILIFIICVSLMSVLDAHDILVKITAGKNDIAAFFPGQNIENHEVYKYTLPEHYLQTIEAEKVSIEAVNYRTGLIIRSSDLRTRVLIDFHKGPEDQTETYPFQLTFYNLAVGDRDGDRPVELQHGTSGYLWLEGGHHVAHLTGPVHNFTIRDHNKDVVFTISLAPAPKEEL